MVISTLVLLIALYFLIGITVDLFVSGISFETETRIFKNFQPGGNQDKNAPYKEAFDKAESILEKLKGRPSVPPLPYRIMLMEHEDPNAFAFPGGTIGVTTGLLAALDEDIEIAYVLGHELGHFHNRDHLQGMGRAIGLRIIMAMVFSSGAGAESFGNMMEFVFNRGYSQDRENKADRFGLELVYAIYGKTEGVDHLFRILQEKDRLPKWAYMFSTHPSPQKRIDNLKAYALHLKKREMDN